MKARRVEFSFDATLSGLEQAFGQLSSALDAHELSAATRYNIELIFEEIVANIIRHGTPPGRAVAVHVLLEVGDSSIVLTFQDNGIPFDPRGRTDPVPAKSLEDATAGGRGLMLVRHAAQSLDYQLTSDQNNRLVITLPRSGHGSS